MKKFIALAAAALVAMSGTPSAAPADTCWDEFVAREAEREKIHAEGPEYFSKIALLAPQGGDAELWRLSCSAPTQEMRAAASAALVKKWFPGGDPANWESVTGFFPSSSFTPKQLVAVNALFNAVDALSRVEGGKYSAAWLMTRFAKSSRAKLCFIDEMPEYFRKVLDDLIAETKMPGDWSSSRIAGPYPFVPLYGGERSMSYATANGLQFLDGAGAVANFGPYAWYRARGFVYRIVDRSDRGFWLRD